MTVGSNKKLLCICEICICGRHHCIHKPKTEAAPKGPCALTEYKDTYRKFSNYLPSKPIKPDAATKLSSQPLDGNTLYTQEYHPHQLEARQKREQPKYVKPSGTFDSESSYQHDYTEKAAEKMRSARPPYQPTTSNRPFSGTTVHKETYIPWESPLNHLVKHQAAIKLPAGKFDYKTTFQSDYTGYTGHPGRQAIKPTEPTLSVGAGRFADETTTRADYTPKNARPEKSAKPMQHVLHHTDPFDHKTTFQHTFQWRNGFPAESCKPVEMVCSSSQPLDGITTHNETYKPWEIPKRSKSKPPTGWIPPSDPFDCKTTFQHDYDGKHAYPAKSARPDYIRVAPGEFKGLTTHKDAFKPWEVNGRENYRPKEAYKPHGKFNGDTTFKTDYKGFSAPRRSLCIPKGSGLGFSGPQEHTTSYRDTYLGERPLSCPVKYLDMTRNIASRNGYVFKIDRNGHQYFKPPHMMQSLEELSFPVQNESLKKSMEVLRI